MSGRLWPYSDQFEGIKGEGHGRPPPRFGAPTLVWHLGVWEEPPIPETLSPDLSRRERRNAIIALIERRNDKLHDEVSRLLSQLQERGAVADTPLQSLQLGARQATAGGHQHEFKMASRASAACTLWWQDRNGDGHKNQRQKAPNASDLRVRVVAQSSLEHVTLSFFIDAGQPWNSPRLFSNTGALGLRRQRIFELAADIQRISAAQMRSGRVDADFAPEHLDNADDARRLLEAADYFYDGVWREFLSDFGIETDASSPAPKSLEGAIFADIRGLVQAAPGLDTPNNMERKQQADALRQSIGMRAATSGDPAASATTGIGRFETFDNESGEPNAVLKAHWPFIRRMAPGADHRDFVGCGILDWRCLFVSPLAARVEPPTRDENDGPDAIAPLGELPEDRDLPNHPLRYLLLTKGEPNRLQIGRFVERINAVTTLRLFALKHWPTIRNAGWHLRVLGRELDDALSTWSTKRVAIENDFETQEKHEWGKVGGKQHWTTREKRKKPKELPAAAKGRPEHPR